MKLSYTQKNKLIRAEIKIADSIILVEEAKTLLNKLCQEAIQDFSKYDDMKEFVELLPHETHHRVDMFEFLSKMDKNVKTGDLTVHSNHCCYTHGCKYGEDDTCPVVQMKVLQRYQCEECMRNYQDLEFKHIVVNNDGVFK